MDIGHGGRIEELDVLRGVAALCVVLSHYSSYCERYFGTIPFGVPVDLIYGFYAVELFFMISGFVIYFTLERSATWTQFAFSRATRLYPAYWTALTLMVVLEHVVFGKPFWAGGYVANMTMFQEFVGVKNLDNVFWSLTVEVAFYVIMGALFVAGLLPRIERVAAIWLGLACVWSVLTQYLGVALTEAIPRLFILRHVPFFVAGITFYGIVRSGATRGRLALLLAALAGATLIDGVSDASVVAVAGTDLLRRLAVAALLFAIFALAVTGRLRFAISPVTLWLGGISYSLYLVHRNLGHSTLVWLHGLGVPVWLGFLATLGGALLLATLLSYTVERPALRALRRWYRARRPAAALRS